MEKLDQAYEAVKMLETLGLPVSPEQLQGIYDMEREYLQEEILPMLKNELEPLVNNFKGSFNVEIKYGKDSGLDLQIVERPKRSLFPDYEPGGKTKSRMKKYLIKVIFPDGYAICHQRVLKTLVEVVEFAGAENVRKLNIQTVTGNLITDEPTDHERYGAGQKQLSTGQYVQTFSSTDTKFFQITTINKELKLGLKVEKVLIDSPHYF